MEYNKTNVMDKIQSELLDPPHVLDTLIHLVIGEWKLTSPQREQLIGHLTACSYCRTALIVLLSVDQEYQRSNASPDEAAISDLLARFEAIHCELESRRYEQIGAYAEAIVAKGKEEADRRFHVLAQHIKECSECTSLLEDTLDFLNETTEAQEKL